MFENGSIQIPVQIIPLILGYRVCIWILTLNLIGGMELIHMNGIEYDLAVLVALIAGSVIAVIVYNVFNLLGKYHEGKTKAKETKIAALEGERELTALENAKIANWEKFDRIFVFEGLINGIVASILTFVGMVYVGLPKLGIEGEPIAAFGVAFIVAVVIAFILDMAVTSSPAKAKWEQKKSKAYDVFLADGIAVVKAMAEQTGVSKLVAKYIRNGYDEQKAKEMAEKAVIANPDLLED